MQDSGIMLALGFNFRGVIEFNKGADCAVILNKFGIYFIASLVLSSLLCRVGKNKTFF